MISELNFKDIRGCRVEGLRLRISESKVYISKKSYLGGKGALSI